MYTKIVRQSIAALVLGIPFAIHAQTPEARLKRAATVYASAPAVTVKFDQTLINPLTERTLVSHGTLTRRAPNLLDITFTDPANDRIVADGTNLWVYLPSSAPGQVIRAPASAGAGTLDPIGAILSTPVDRYTISDGGSATTGGRATHGVVVAPKGKASFTQATLWIGDDDGAIRGADVTESTGLVRKVVVREIRIGAPKSSAFRFDVPKGVRVIDGRSFGVG